MTLDKVGDFAPGGGVPDIGIIGCPEYDGRVCATMVVSIGRSTKCVTGTVYIPLMLSSPFGKLELKTEIEDGASRLLPS